MSSLALFASLGMILSGGVFFWLAWRQGMARHHLLIASGSVVAGLGWFLPSDAAQASVAVAAGIVMLVGAVLLMRATWRQASIHQQ